MWQKSNFACVHLWRSLSCICLCPFLSQSYCLALGWHLTLQVICLQSGGNFENDGILIEPFNLKHEREEGYFDADGNFVEYIGEKETKVSI